jgi:hypothetical protein
MNFLLPIGENLKFLILGILSNLSSFKATTSRICEIFGAGVSLVAAMAAAFLHGWKMEMVLLLVFPAIAIAFCIKTRTVERHQQKYHRLMLPANDVSNVILHNFKCYCVASAMKPFTLKGVKTIHPLRCNIWNTIVKLFLKHCITTGCQIEP